MKDITSSVYNFEDLIQGNFLYVDKTEYIWQLIRPAKEMYFLSRPRRFGKSLTVSTLKAVFEGKKELFKGLAIYDKPYDWKPYPVIHLSFGDYNVDSDAQKELSGYLMAKIKQVAESYSIKLNNATPGLCFGELIDRLYEIGPVVVLIDEYDKPILDNIVNPEISKIQRSLKGFFSVLKDRNDKERFLFVTGVSKFCHVSLFSDLNNLTDITMDARYAAMFGYTQDELEANFGDRISALAGDTDINAYKAKIKEWYNGYRFHKSAKTVYNPVSLAKFF
ncbi:MAG: AAA family ATPase, partial [Lentisphaeria bacterium]|nr:AAA family ATPase [Lentisphaeria bacterium]